MPVTYQFTGVDDSEWPFVGAAAVSSSTPLRLAEEPTGLGGVEPRHEDDQAVDQLDGPPDDVHVAVRDRVKSPRIQSDAHGLRLPAFRPV